MSTSEDIARLRQHWRAERKYGIFAGFIGCLLAAICLVGASSYFYCGGWMILAGFFLSGVSAWSGCLAAEWFSVARLAHQDLKATEEGRV